MGKYQNTPHLHHVLGSETTMADLNLEPVSTVCIFVFATPCYTSGERDLCYMNGGVQAIDALEELGSST